MNDEQVWDTLVMVMRETFERDDLVVTRDMTARDVSEWDSLSNVELMVAVESAFRVRLRTGEIAGLRNVGELRDVIASRIHDPDR
jgi:acyl carrier protein